MENPISLQLIRFAWACAWGFGLGILYELGGLLRMGGRFWRTALADSLFWLLTGVLTTLFLLFLNGGAPWGYMLSGMTGGGILERLTLGNGADRLNSWLADRLRRKKRVKKAKKSKKTSSILLENKV